MNRRLSISVLALSIIFLASPFCVTAQAKTIIPFDWTYTPTSGTETIVDEKYTPDGLNRIAKGTTRLEPYNGPLGTGTLYSEAIISITHYSAPLTNFCEWYGHGNYRYILNITDGPYGSGTLEGVWVCQWDANLTRPFGPQTHYWIWGNLTLDHGTGDLEGVKVDATLRYVMVGGPGAPYKHWVGEIILP